MSVMAVFSEGRQQEHCSYPQGSRMNLVGDDPEHAVVVPGGLLAPTAKTGLMAAVAGDEIAGGSAMAHPTVILAEENVENPIRHSRCSSAGGWPGPGWQRPRKSSLDRRFSRSAIALRIIG